MNTVLEERFQFNNGVVLHVTYLRVRKCIGVQATDGKRTRWSAQLFPSLSAARNWLHGYSGRAWQTKGPDGV